MLGVLLEQPQDEALPPPLWLGDLGNKEGKTTRIAIVNIQGSSGFYCFRLMFANFRGESSWMWWQT